ncbi:MAG: hypothetical protein NT069_04840 [Planctomycetota bacterium]|nr:hypothetical protein [Planctomycetota bacterium]
MPVCLLPVPPHLKYFKRLNQTADALELVTEVNTPNPHDRLPSQDGITRHFRLLDKFQLH